MMILPYLRRSAVLLSLLSFGLSAAGCQSGANSNADAPAQETAAAPEADPAKLEEYVTWLADDARTGREAGTPGYEASADYVAARFDELGLTPGGDDGSWFQTVPLRGVTRDLEAQAMSLAVNGQVTDLSPMEDFLMNSSSQRETAEVTAPLVFVGYGIHAPEFDYDNYAGVDVAGKIVVALGGMPDVLPSEEAAHHGANKYKVADEMGAVGYITIPTEAYEQRRPFDSSVARAGTKGVTWIGQDGEGFTTSPGLIATSYMSADGAATLFEASDMSYADLREAAAAGAIPAAFDLPGTLTMQSGSIHEDLESRNVVGMIKGADPALADEYVVLTAHLDHIGERTSIDPEKDNINNGAMDNASGVAILLEEARMLKEASANGNPPRRSVIFLALTAEEKGLIGSEYFAYNPTVPIEDIVGNVNLDMALYLFDFVDVIAWGAEHSSLGPVVEQAAASMGLELIPDPVPELSIFTRSDHYRFVQQGVPAVFLFTGFGNGGEEVFNDFMANHYHQPSDEIDLPIDYEAGAKFAKLNYLITRAIADADERPSWNEGNYFGELYGRD